MQNEDQEAQDSIEKPGRSAHRRASEAAAIPRDRQKMIDVDKTPGAGALPSPGEKDVEPGSG